MTSLAWFQACVEVRRRHWAWLRLALVLGIAGAVILAALAAADRTHSAYGRFLDETTAFDVLIANGGTTPTNANRQFDFDALAARDDVAASSAIRTWLPVGRTASGRSVTTLDILPVTMDAGFGRKLNAALVLDTGRHVFDGHHDADRAGLVAQRPDGDVLLHPLEG